MFDIVGLIEIPPLLQLIVVFVAIAVILFVLPTAFGERSTF